ncbi:hypothetical protein KY319_04115 [Candidatus Woesearchaeota archaeon]|nr:hypothetical protein [Candidatus Woesearchaeota archaeon]
MDQYMKAIQYSVYEKNNGTPVHRKTVDDYRDALDFVIEEIEKWNKNVCPDKKPTRFTVKELFVFPGRQVVDGFIEVYVPEDLARLKNLSEPSVDF